MVTGNCHGKSWCATARPGHLGIPVACVSWTVTHEEVFRELREWLSYRSKHAPKLYQRKSFYLLACEYYFSHYVAAIFIALANFKLLVAGWRGYLIGWLSLVWIANAYMSAFGRLRLDIKHEHIEFAASESDKRIKETAMPHRGSARIHTGNSLSLHSSSDAPMVSTLASS